jgi:hypothetical protein
MTTLSSPHWDVYGSEVTNGGVGRALAMPQERSHKQTHTVGSNTEFVQRTGLMAKKWKHETSIRNSCYPTDG